MKKSKIPDFSNKLVSFSLATDDHTYAINRPKIEIQLGRLFLVGTVPAGASAGDWSEGAVCAVAWDQVNNYLVFESAQHYAKALRKFRKSKRNS